MDNWTPLVITLVSAAVGYALGMVRDHGQFKANRKARHEDETLQAAAALLDGARAMSKASQELAYAVYELSPSTGNPPDVNVGHEARRQQAFKDQDAARAVYRPALLKLSILKPALEPMADQLIAHTGRSGNSTERWEAASAKFGEAEKSFINEVRSSLGIKVPKTK